MKTRTFAGFVAPSVLVMLLLMVAPLATAVWLSLHYVTFSNLTTPVFSGLDNYRYLLNDSEFWRAVRFTLRYIAITVPLQIVLGLGIALLLDQVRSRDVRGAYIAAVLLPFIVTPVVGTLMFRQALDRTGIVTFWLEQLSGQRVNFFLNSASVQTLILVHGVWATAPFATIVLFAGLQTLPQEPVEAATVDGATWLQRLWWVVLPHLRPLFVFIALIATMDAYRVFDSIFVLTKQNPIYQAETIMLYNYRVALSVQQLGRANAMSVLTVLGIFVLLVPFLVLTYREQTQER